MTLRALVAVIAVGLAGCGDRVVELDPGRDGADASLDAPVLCVPGATQCTDCADNDLDGTIDGFDIECTGSYDNDESGFGTDKANDNGNVQRQDCFFDGDSGSGSNELCDIHTCCELVTCPADFPGPVFNPDVDCVVGSTCPTYCEPLVPPGCDCFGCCTVCPAGNCVNIYIHPAVAPTCDADTIADPEACPRCTLNPECGQPCGGTTCILCPGQTLDDLPPTCTGATCPGGGSPCGGNTDCAADQFCASGCCVAVVE